eukprot:347700-Rhodomonas_salina.1
MSSAGNHVHGETPILVLRVHQLVRLYVWCVEGGSGEGGKERKEESERERGREKGREEEKGSGGGREREGGMRKRERDVSEAHVRQSS